MAGPQRMHALPLLLFFLFSLSFQYFAEGHRKISPSKLPNRVLISSQSSSPNFFNAFDHTSFQTPGSTHANTLNNKDSVNFNDNIHKDDNPFTFKDSSHKGLSSNNYAFYPHTYNNDENFAKFPTSDYKANRGKFSYPRSSSYGGQGFPASFEESVPNKKSSSYGGQEFPTSFEESFPNKESINGKESSASDRQQGLYSTPSGEKPLYASPSNERSWYTAPSGGDANVYASSSNEQRFHSSSPSNYRANYPFDANESPSMPKVSEFDAFAKSHPVSNYDSYFNTPTINKNFVQTPSLGHTSFPSRDHDLTYGQVQVP